MPDTNNVTLDSNVRYIKLGDGGRYARECIENGYARLGYDSVSHETCKAGRWDEIDSGHKRGALQEFYEDDEETIWITFHGGMMYWTRLKSEVRSIDEDSYFKVRDCVGGWHNEGGDGTSLEEYKISGELLKVKNYRGTICEPSGSEVALRLITEQLPESVKELQSSREETHGAVTEVIKRFNPDDLELLVDLVVRESGFQRRFQLGGRREVVDLEAENPLTDEVMYIQVKTESSLGDVESFRDDIAGTNEYPGDKYYFVTTKPGSDLFDSGHQETGADDESPSVELVDAERLAEWILDVGLTKWVMEKASSY